ncbi:MAG: CBS domain-containing protein, partial [Thermodesulfobacteriota bacterium]
MKEKLLKDFMRPLDAYPCIREDGTIREALDLMRKTRVQGGPKCLLVVGPDPGGKQVIKGFITPVEIVFGLA